MTGNRTKRAFSYLRFSDRKQAKGDSLRRQLEWGPTVCSFKGWTLDTSLHLEDLGISAFRGRNAAKGNLAAFLEAIRSHRVAPGDVLLLEALDRLTRQDIDPAWELFRSILKAGVEIYTREPVRHYVRSDLNNLGSRIEVQAYLLRNYNESEVKSLRGREYWKSMRAKVVDGLPIHKVCPAWLRVSDDRKRFEVIPAAAKAVKLIYKLAGDGLGIDPILAHLNRKPIPPIARRDSWRRLFGDN